MLLPEIVRSHLQAAYRCSGTRKLRLTTGANMSVMFRVAAMTCAISLTVPAWSMPPIQGGAQHAESPGGGTDGAPGDISAVGRTLHIEAHDMSFSPNVVLVHPGETVRLVISNRGTMRHEFVIASKMEHLEHRAMMRQKPDIDMANEPNAVTVDPGQSKELIWRFGRNPNVEFSCDIPGHAKAGMTGFFRVAR
jgi:uncharacterized cupredoxin-like copper-binding protein